MQNKFNPQPGDKIICNNGEEFICCEQEFLLAKGCLVPKYENTLFGFQDDPNNSVTGVEWAYWDSEGESDAPSDWNIREVIPAESKEVVKEEEPRYTVEEVTEAFENALHYCYLGGRLEGINKIKDYLSKKNNAEYQEYLRLKAIYE